MKIVGHPTPYLFLLSAGILAMAACGASQNNEVEIDSVVPESITLVAANTTAYSEIEILGRVVSAAETTEGDPVADAEVIISIPYNGVFPVAGNANAFLVYDSLDSSVRTQISGNYFTTTTDASGIFRLAVSVPVGGEYSTNLYFIAGNAAFSYPISVAVE